MKRKTKKVVSNLVVTAIMTTVVPVGIFAQEIGTKSEVKKEQKQNEISIQEDKSINYTKEDAFYITPEGCIESYSSYKGGIDVKIPPIIRGIKVTSIGDSAFLSDNIRSVEIPESVTSIGNYAFEGNQLTNIKIPNSVINIGNRAFRDNKLIHVEISNSATSIGDIAFEGNKLTNVEIPESVTSIGNSAFEGNKLTTVEIPDSVTSIGTYAFASNELTNLKISNSITSIEDSAFRGNKLTNVEIPDSVTSIGDSAFSENQLISVKIPDSITNIGNFAFANNQLTNVKIPSGMIGEGAFYNNQLINVEILNKVTSIGSVSFKFNQLIDAEIPNSVTNIADDAFTDQYLNLYLKYKKNSNGNYILDLKQISNIDKITGVEYGFKPVDYNPKTGIVTLDYIIGPDYKLNHYIEVGNDKVKSNMKVLYGLREYKSEVKELVGDNRFDTAVKVSQIGWNSSENAVLVNASSLADALSVTPFASQENAPVLLSDVNSLNQTTKEELKRLGVKKVYAIGGTTVISENVVNELKSMGVTVERISGQDRYETSLAIANRLKNISEIAVVNGEQGFADAVSIAPVCARDNIAIVYTSPRNGLKTFENYIKTNNITKSYVVGGTTVLPDKLINGLKNTTRIAGSNRNLTNLHIIEKFFSNTNFNNQTEFNDVFVSKNGYEKPEDLIDALSVGVLASKQNAPVMLVSPNGLDKNQSTTLHNTFAKRLTKVGGNGNETGFTQLQKEINNVK